MEELNSHCGSGLGYGVARTFNHWMEIAHNLDNRYLDWLFQQNVFPLRELTSIMSGNGKAGSHLRNYLEVH